MQSKIDKAVFDDIRRTINRFRENPFYYFTESDIHSSLYRDILEGYSNIFYPNLKQSSLRVSLLHHEYPTSFRYKKDQLGEWNYFKEDSLKLTDPNGNHGDRGNYDLVVLDPEITNLDSEFVKVTLKDIINKNIKTKSYEKVKPLFFIEVKFLHLFNYNHINMFKEVKRDNEKLALGLHYTKNAKALNLVFCAADNSSDTSVISQIKSYIRNSKDTVDRNMTTVFVQSYLDEYDIKVTPKPFCNIDSPQWAKEQFPI